MCIVDIVAAAHVDIKMVFLKSPYDQKIYSKIKMKQCTIQWTQHYNLNWLTEWVKKETRN